MRYRRWSVLALVACFVGALGVVGGCSSAVTGSGSLAPVVDSLLPAPAGSQPWTLEWAKHESVTPQQYVDFFYRGSDRTAVTRELRTEGIRDVAHRTWTASDNSQIDLVLLRFTSPQGALSRFLQTNSATSARTDVDPFTVGSLSADVARGYRDQAKTAAGQVAARVYAHPARSVYTLEAYFYSVGTFAEPDLVGWVGQQLDRID